MVESAMSEEPEKSRGATARAERARRTDSAGNTNDVGRGSRCGDIHEACFQIQQLPDTSAGLRTPLSLKS